MNLRGLCVCVILLFASETWAQGTKRPNILWLTCEDSSCNLGCYHDKDAITPNLDQFAKEGVLYRQAFSVAGVCAPSRSCLILGMYPSTVGSQYMRCEAKLPEEIKTYSKLLRDAGYYCSNNVKTDYNLSPAVPAGSWDANSAKAHYRDRKKDQPFFAIFNNTVTHESQIRTAAPAFAKSTARLSDKERHDPAKITIPPFHPDTPTFRRGWARYHDLVTVMDKWVADHLSELEKQGLADDTIVFFYSDHGVGLPRGKRWLYDSGMKVPLIIRFGKNFAHLAPSKPGSTSDRLVSFVDFGPTALSLAGAKIPANMQGLAFLGEATAKPREAVYGIRDRMDERNDTTRAVRDAQFKYLRNYQWFKPWIQRIDYMDQMPAMAEWRKLAASGKLSESAALWMRPTKPFEELYDVTRDPHELNNLAADPAHAKTLARMRTLHKDWMKQTRDLGLLPEAEVEARSRGRTRFELGQDPKSFPQDRLIELAELVASEKPIRKLLHESKDADSALRWWAATGLGIHGKDDKPSLARLKEMLKGDSMNVRVAAGAALRRLGHSEGVLPVLISALSDDNPWVRHAAALAIDDFGKEALPAKEALQKAKKDKNSYVGRVVEHTLQQLGE
jgi:uncharacterized sulfatase